MSERGNIHRTGGNGNDPGFWEEFNVKASVVNYFVIAVIGIVTGYTSFILAQQNLANQIDKLKDGQAGIEKQMTERSNTRSAEIREIKDTLKNDAVSEKILDLKLKPIQDELTQQRALMEKIALAVKAER